MASRLDDGRVPVPWAILNFEPVHGTIANFRWDDCAILAIMTLGAAYAYLVAVLAPFALLARLKSSGAR